MTEPDASITWLERRARIAGEADALDRLQTKLFDVASEANRVGMSADARSVLLSISAFIGLELSRLRSCADQIATEYREEGNPEWQPAPPATL